MGGIKVFILAALTAYLVCTIPCGKAQDTTTTAGDTTTSSVMTTTTTKADTPATGATSGTTKPASSVGGTTSCSDQKTTTRAPKPWEQFFNPGESCFQICLERIFSF